MDDNWEFTTANTVALISAILIMIAFIFMPWIGDKLTENAARFLSDFLYGTAGAKPAPFIWLVPVISLLGVGLSLWSLMTTEHGRIVSVVCSILGWIGLGFCFYTLSYPPYRELDITMGIGFWTAMIGMAGMGFQIILAHPGVVAVLEKLTSGSSGVKISPKVVPYLFLIPPLTLYLIWIIAPTFYTMYLSLTNWDGVTDPNFVGLANFERLFTKDRMFIESLWNNLRWLLVFILVPTTVGLGLAMIFNQEMLGGKAYKVSFYAPLVLSLPVIGLIWSWLYNPRLGLINNFLSIIGFENLPGWLGDRELAIWCVIVAATWRQVGYVMILYLAGLKNIDVTLIDAARVDGADRWNMFRFVVFPLLAPVTTIVVVISIIDSLRAFDLVSIMTRGGQSTQVLANFMYIEAFNNYRMGYGAAIAVVLFAISLVFISFYLSRVAKEELEY